MFLNETKPPLDEVMLMHHGVKGQKWGVRREPSRTYSTMTKEQRKAAQKAYGNFGQKAMADKFGAEATLFRNPMSEAEYQKLKNKDEIIRKGSVLYRTTSRKNEEFQGITYVSTNRKDADIYKATMASMGLRGLGAKSYKNQYEVTLKALETLKSPSEKARVDAFTALMDTPSIVLKNGKTITGRELLKRTPEFKKDAKRLDAHQLGLQAYKNMATEQWMSNPVNTAYFKALRDKGYNSIVDDNDRGHLSDQPLILLNPNGSVKRMSVTPVSADEINRVKSQLKPR